MVCNSYIGIALLIIMPFKLISKLKPAGEQPKAIKELVKNIKNGQKHQVLLGVTGSGKTYVMSNIVKQTQMPGLVISHNKTLAAQLYQEFKDFFPNNAVHYFVSYYDYYQPEAYIPQTDTYIEKDAKINQEIDRLRHAAVQDLISRKDIIITASVSCIYNIGSPEDYESVSLKITNGQEIKRKDFLARLTALQYKRNDTSFEPGQFRVRGDNIGIHLVTGEEILQIEFSGDKINKIVQNKKEHQKVQIFPASFWISPEEKLKIAIENIKLELQERLKQLKSQNKLLETQRLEQRTNYDLEMLAETGYCHGIENYSSHMEFRKPGDPPFSLIDYFKKFHKNFLIFVDESHQTLPQVKAMAVQDRIRKQTLIDNGFRLPSAIDNRPLTFKEFEKRINKVIYVSATPSLYEKNKANKNIVELLIRPTGLLEPKIELKPTKNQLEDLIKEINKRIEKKQKVLVLTLTKRLAEAISDYLAEKKIKNKWLHSEVKTLERPEILRNLRMGKYDVLVGINLLREGLDLPEVSLVAILDADKEGFLRNETTLIQIMGRAARHSEGSIILYAEKETESIKKAIKEINRRRKIQQDYNKKHNIIPKAINKEIRDWEFLQKEKQIASEFMMIKDKKFLEKEMKKAAKELDFERAAEIRDLIKKL